VEIMRPCYYQPESNPPMTGISGAIHNWALFRAD